MRKAITTALATLLTVAAIGSAQATRVQVDTQLGSFQIELFEDVAPNTVANFLNYVNDGRYDQTFFHRTISGFVMQGGGFTFADGDSAPSEIPRDGPVVNEFSLSNVSGTVAMAKITGDPDSATSEWFVNLVDNTDLDEANGGFTVFGEVVGDGMQAVEGIVAQSSVFNFQGAFTNLPLVNYSGAGLPAESSFIFTTVRVVEDQPFAINPGVAGSWFNADQAGQGFFVDVIEDADGTRRLFVSWFTFNNEDPPAEEDFTFGATQQRWFTALGPIDGDTATMDLFRSSGGVFDDPREAATDPVGTLTMRFTGCGNAVISYSFSEGDGGSGEIPVVRLSPDVFCGDIVENTLVD
ncbi:MAG: peptidylprolyl isomerase [Pseudomonadota bacterium]